MTPPLTRSSDEAHLYMGLHPCVCGETDFGTTSSVAEDGGGWLVRYTGRCVECGRDRSFEFRQPEHLVVPADGAWAAFWSQRGRQVRDAQPGRFRRLRLEAARDTYRALLAELPVPGPAD